jgi:hypothetical protein
MAKSRQSLLARVTQTAGGPRKKPTNRVERAFDDVKKLVSDAAGTRKRTGRQRQAAAKQTGTARIRSGQQRQAAAKRAARGRRAKTS